MTRPSVVLLVNNVQDVMVLRPLALLAARETDADLRILLSPRFQIHDEADGRWRIEVESLARQVGAEVLAYADSGDVLRHLQGGRGVIVAGAESDLSEHAIVHNALRAAPAEYLRVTVQHGLECVGFLHNRAHDLAHGEEVRFAADVVCAWTAARRLRSLVPSQRGKVLVTGPTLLLQRPELGPARRPARGGVVCENLHSVRMNVTGAQRRPFMDMFREFCTVAALAGQAAVTLRPHPGGQYLRGGGAPLPSNVVLNSNPTYRMDLAAHAWGISAPSTVVLDMALAGIPVAVWHDADGAMDVSTYEGLECVSTLEGWVGFVRAASLDRAAILERQRLWLEGLEMPLDPREVYRRFATLLVGATTRQGLEATAQLAGAGAVAGHRVEATGPATARVGAEAARAPEHPRSILLACDRFGPSQALSFGDALAGRATVTVLEFAGARQGLAPLLPLEIPDVVAISRPLSPLAGPLIDWARRLDVPVVFHIDDDLLDVPDSLGERLVTHYRSPDRLGHLRATMEGSDLVYASTPFLAERLRLHGLATPIVAGAIGCSVDPAQLRRGSRSDAPTLGYMGSSGHAPDLDLVVPVIEALLDEMPMLRFELFGNIAMPPRLERFGGRVRHHDVLRGYKLFLERLRELGWWVGIAPLADHPFNRCKTDCKWLEYSFAGIATVAQDLPVYARACAGGAGRLAGGPEDWLQHLRELLTDHPKREAQVAAAQAKLRTVYTHDALADQVLGVLADARAYRTRLAGAAA